MTALLSRGVFAPLPVVGRTGLFVAAGMTEADVRAEVRARRWRRYGKAVVAHNGPLTVSQRRAVVLVNAGPRAMLTSFTALEIGGLQNWRRDACHVLVPAGARVRIRREHDVVVHSVRVWPPPSIAASAWVHTAAPAALVAAGSLTRPRDALALLAATVQQRLTVASELESLAVATPNLRHRALLLAGLADIGMGAHALSEIDFARLCRRAGLVEPTRQAVRVEASGRRRYLDVEWVRADGRRVVAEVDGAMHLLPGQWWDDQLRQNEITVGRSVVLRFPAAVVRERDPVVVDQLRRAGVPSAS